MGITLDSLTGVARMYVIIDFLVHFGPVIFGFHSCHDFFDSKMSSSCTVVMVSFEGFKSKVSGQSKLLNPFIFILLIAFDSSLEPVIQYSVANFIEFGCLDDLVLQFFIIRECFICQIRIDMFKIRTILLQF